ncbi:hypothetical protein, partial [Pseudomonas sp. CCC2.2]|uniref:hypothetical protein n=1 Tax=Pseudomonas sp. CCC2.2 TaxID=3048605 RepID=UPI002B22C044
MNHVPGTENQRWTVTCQDAAEGTGDMIVPLPDELLSEMGLVIGDTLTIQCFKLSTDHETLSSFGRPVSSLDVR